MEEKVLIKTLRKRPDGWEEKLVEFCRGKAYAFEIPRRYGATTIAMSIADYCETHGIDIITRYLTEENADLPKQTSKSNIVIIDDCEHVECGQLKETLRYADTCLLFGSAIPECVEEIVDEKFVFEN